MSTPVESVAVVAPVAGLERTAFHEAGHCVAAWKLGGEVTSVTIEPCENFAGLALWNDGADDGWLEGLDVAAPVLLWPASVRAIAETRGAVSLAGDVAAELLLASESGRWPEPIADRVAAHLAAVDEAFELRADERTALAAAATRSHGSDAEHVAELEWALHGGDVAAAAHHVAWLTAQVRTLLAHYWPAVEAVAEALLRERTLPGRHVTQLILNATGGH